ncbi:hypothetical protein OC835_006484 [Tilletia horrida]|nr:hypothetical protein OC835_006484 [Tilletia horrida]
MSAANPLADLLSHNEHWCSETCTKKPDLFKTCAAGQAPKVLWIGCSDSRVPESVITEADPGQIFVTRNIANQFNPEDDNVVSVLTYGVQALGVEHVVVVGHTSCGGMIAATGAAATGAAPGGALGRYLTPLVGLAKKLKENEEAAKLEQPEFVRLLTEESVKQSMRHIASTEVIKDNWAGKASPLSGKGSWVHDVGTGKLRDLNVSLLPPDEEA